MTEVTGKVQIHTSEMSDAERRRRLAAVYRRLIKLAQQDRSPDIPAEAGDKEPNSQFDFGCSNRSSGES